LRRRRETSPLFDLPRLTSNLEAAYVRMWQTWCGGERAAAFAVAAS
jgi:protein O-GlcNAc transferase